MRLALVISILTECSLVLKDYVPFELVDEPGTLSGVSERPAKTRPHAHGDTPHTHPALSDHHAHGRVKHVHEENSHKVEGEKSQGVQGPDHRRL